ncbi:MAG TPA: hypothetical protein VMV54_05095 [Acidocella sp.]|nr:hypothetical protein [Acidocella sp.]
MAGSATRMLTIAPRIRGRARQGGIILIVALIMLVAMTLAAIALVRSVDTSNIIAGNLAFKEAASHSGDAGIESAISWLETNNSGTTLYANVFASGYAASRQDPGPGQSWDDFWTVLANNNQVVTLPADASGNTVSYAIQRLCNAVGDPASPGTACAVSPTVAAAANSSQNAGSVALLFNSQVYYRITARIGGPRNTVDYVQAVVAL